MVGGGGSSPDARHTNSMKAYNSTDMAGNSHRDSTHMDSTHPGIQTQFRPKPEHQNAAREQKRILRPPMQLREVFSSSLFYLPMIRREAHQEPSDFSSGATGPRQPRNATSC